MLTARARQSRLGNERGAAIVLFAIVLPVILAFGSLVLTVGNWWVHKKHLQTQVDAAAFAGATEFFGCNPLFDPLVANQAIKAAALEYAGDSLRTPSTIDPDFIAPVRNPQVQQPDDVRVALNSASYWSSVNGMNPVGGYGLDDTMATPGDPCTTRSLDVKATDDESPTLWGWLPFVASPKTKAKVEIFQVFEERGMLPFAVPEIDPKAVIALFVNENGAGAGALLGWQELCKPGDPGCEFLTPPNSNFSYWMTTPGQEVVDIPSENTSVIILISKNDKPPALDLSGTLSDICTQDPGLVRCHAGSSLTSGVNFIHGWSDASAEPSNPEIRDVSLFGIGCWNGSAPYVNPSDPYFLNDAGCDVGVTAKIDFAFPDDPRPNPTAGIRARVDLYASTNCGGSATPMNWTETDPSNNVSTWVSDGGKTINAASGRNPLSIGWATQTEEPDPPPPGKTQKVNHEGCFPLVAAPYAANDASGPLEYVDISGTDDPDDYPPVIDSNSRNTGPNHNVFVTVGLNKPLKIEPPLNPPFLLRFASRSGSLNQALDCDAGIDFKDEVADGCQTFYSLNYYDWDEDGPLGTPYTWDDINCADYPSPSDLPPPTFEPPGDEIAPNCVAAKTGDVVAMRQGLFERFQMNPDAPAAANGCWPNNWPSIAADIEGWIKKFGPKNDPRYVTLVITDFTAFTGAGAENVPVKYFGGFYATGWDIGPAGGGNQTGCPDFDGVGPYKGNDPHPRDLNDLRDNGDVWGHFVNFVEPTSAGEPAAQLCNFNEIGKCIARLTE